MSALQRQTYANSTQPLFVTASGGSGEDLTLNELNINQGGNITLGSSINNATSIVFNKALDGSTITQMQELFVGDSTTDLALTLIDQASEYDALQIGNLFAYGLGTAYGAANYLSFNGSGPSFGLSYGTTTVRNVYLDGLDSGIATLTSKCVGPVPVSFVVGGPFAVNPVPTSPAPFDSFLIAPLYPTTSGQEYDVCAKGTIALASGSPNPTVPDEFTVTVSVGGTGNGTQKYSFNPNYLTWTVRDRLISTSSAPSIVVSVQNTQVAGSTAVYSCAITMGDVVRVK